MALPLLVYFQITLLEKSCFTELAEKRFFAFLMNLFMFVQVRLSELGFQTDALSLICYHHRLLESDVGEQRCPDSVWLE